MTSAAHEELVRFMQTLQPPHGETGASFLARYDAEFNTGGPPAHVERAVPITELAGWRLSADVYRPPNAESAPRLVYLHGGGWTMGNPGTHDRMARMLAAAGYLVASIDYPRAPKWRFPAAYDGGVAALQWFGQYGDRARSAQSRVSVAGDSAGANLAAAVAAAETGVTVDAVGLLYGVYDYHRALPTLAALMGGGTADTQCYVPAACFEQLRDDPRLNPERAADRLPPCWIGVGSADPLLAESTALAAELDRAGRDYELHIAPGSPHSFMQIPSDAGYESGWAALLAFLEAHR